MKKNILLPFTALIALSYSALADPYNTNTPAKYHAVPPQHVAHPYIGIAYGYSSVEDSYYDGYNEEYTDIDYDSLMLQVGYEFSPYIAAEFRYWRSVSDGDYSLYTSSQYPPTQGSYENFDAWGIYVKPQYPVTEQFSIYGLFGFSGVQVDGDPQWGFDLLDDTAFSWGLGAAVNFTPNISAFVDFVSLYDDTYYDYGYGYGYYDPNGTQVHTINLGLTYKF